MGVATIFLGSFFAEATAEVLKLRQMLLFFHQKKTDCLLTN
jgi:hypothetical protein